MAYIYRATKLEDFEDYLTIKSDKLAIKWSGFATAPDREKLKAHFCKLINNPKVYLFFLKDDETHEIIGYQEMDEKGEDMVESTGHSIRQKFQGCGYAEEMMSYTTEIIRSLGYKWITGWISEKNKGSMMNAINSGAFKNKSVAPKEVYLAYFDRTDLFYRFDQKL